jgi:hypothetical protein
MISNLQRRLTVLLVLCGVGLCGCSSGPTAIAPIDVDASNASEKALETYDTDADGSLNDAELIAVPGILKHKDKYDLDEDGLVSGEEIAHRIDLWQDQKMGIRTLNVKIRLGNRPLSGADVRFVPETYLGEAPKIGSGTTDSQGFTKISVAFEDLPEDLRKARMLGIYGGTYKIEITHPTIKIAPKYNTATILGEEIARDTLGDELVIQIDKG